MDTNRFSLVLIILFALVIATAQEGLSQLIQSTAGREPQEPRIVSSLPVDAEMRPDQHFKVWVFFIDKGIMGNDEIELMVEDAVSRIPEETLSRRKKATGNEKFSGFFDLEVSGEYVRGIISTGALHRTTSRWLNAISVLATAREIEEIALLPFVHSIKPVAGFVRPELPPEMEALDEGPYRPLERVFQHDYGNSFTQAMQIVVPPLHDLGYTGNGILIGVLDTGFRKDHIALSGLDIVAEHDFVFDDDDTQYDPSNPDDYSDFHGTGVVSIMAGNVEGEIIGPAFGASFLLGKTEDIRSETPIEEDYWVEGIEWMETQGALIVSSSLGYTTFDGGTGYLFSDLDGNTAVTTVAADFAASLGVLVVNAAGNSRNDDWGRIITPSDGDSVVAVGAVDRQGSLASFSSPGPTYDGRIKPDVCAMGVSNYFALNVDTVSYSNGNGTSFATPLVAGASALLLEANPSWTAIDVVRKLKGTASQSGSPDNDYGWGIINTLRAADLNIPFVLFLETTVDDDSTGESLGNGNGFPEAGETIELAVTVTNLGDTTATGLMAVLRTQDIYITLYDSTETFTDLEPDDSMETDDDFDFTLSDSIPTTYQVPFIIQISDGEAREWEYTFDLSTGQLFRVSGEILAPDLSPLFDATALIMGPIDSLGRYAAIDTIFTDADGFFEAQYLPGHYSVQAEQEGFLRTDGVPLDLPPDTSLIFVLQQPEFAVDADSVVIWLDEDLVGSDTVTVTNSGTGLLFFSVQEANPTPLTVQQPGRNSKILSHVMGSLFENAEFYPISTREADVKGKGLKQGFPLTLPPVDSLWNLVYIDTDQNTDMDIKNFYIQVDTDGGMLYLRLTGWRPWVDEQGDWMGAFVLDTDTDPLTGGYFEGGEYILVRDTLIGEYVLVWNNDIQDYEFLDYLPYAMVGDSTMDLGIDLSALEFSGEDPELAHAYAAFIWLIDLDSLITNDVFPDGDGSDFATISVHDDDWLEVVPGWGYIPSGESSEIIINVDMESQPVEVLNRSLLFVYNEPSSQTYKLPVVVHTPTGVEGEGKKPSVPRAFSLSQNYPNPFNPSTTIRYDIPTGSGKIPVKVTIYDLRGRLVKKLVERENEPGRYQVHWDGRDEGGQYVSSGVYMYRIEAGDFRFTKKMLLVR
jgi:subtilisin family serine protease